MCVCVCVCVWGVWQLWNAHVLPARVAGSHLDVRQSSYKKLGDFLKAKVKQGLLDTQVDKKTKEAKLVRVNRSHPAYREYVPSHSTAAAAEAAAAGEEKAKEQVQVVSVFKASHDQLPLFEAMGGSKGNLYTLQEVCVCVCVWPVTSYAPGESSWTQRRSFRALRRGGDAAAGRWRRCCRATVRRRRWRERRRRRRRR